MVTEQLQLIEYWLSQEGSVDELAVFSIQARSLLTVLADFLNYLSIQNESVAQLFKFASVSIVKSF